MLRKRQRRWRDQLVLKPGVPGKRAWMPCGQRETVAQHKIGTMVLMT